jgi:DNA-binding transcriptional MocR family regulator
VADDSADRGQPTSAEQIVVPPGALAGTAIVSAAMIDRDTRVVVESPVYPDAVHTFMGAGARPLTAAVDGLDAWDLESLLSTLPRMRPRGSRRVPRPGFAWLGRSGRPGTR